MAPLSDNNNNVTIPTNNELEGYHRCEEVTAGAGAAAADIMAKDHHRQQEQSAKEEDDLDEIMEMDEQIGFMNLLGDDIFGSSGSNNCCVSPTGPLEELACMNIDYDFSNNNEGDDYDYSCVDLLVPFLDDEEDEQLIEIEPSPTSDYDDYYYYYYSSTTPPSSSSSRKSMSVDEMYETTIIKNLQGYMKRSEESRMSLTFKTPQTKTYYVERSESISGVITSIESSSRQVQTYLKNRISTTKKSYLQAA